MTFVVENVVVYVGRLCQLYVINLVKSWVCWPLVRMQLSFTIYVEERERGGEGILGLGNP